MLWKARVSCAAQGDGGPGGGLQPDTRTRAMSVAALVLRWERGGDGSAGPGFRTGVEPQSDEDHDEQAPRDAHDN